MAVGEEVHSSVRSMLRDHGRRARSTSRGPFDRRALRAALARDDDGVFAVVATAGTTNLGVIDDLSGIAEVCRERGLWLHVDGAYGPGRCARRPRDRFAGIEHADSFIVDPHKWLFAPFDSCALVYRDHAYGRAAHRQHARTWSRCMSTTRRSTCPTTASTSRAVRAACRSGSRSPCTGPTRTRAVERTLALTREVAAEIGARAELELALEPELSVVVFRRRGWGRRLRRLGGPPARGRHRVRAPDQPRRRDPARLALVNPRTTLEDIRSVLDAMI